MPDNVQLPATGVGTADVKVATRKVTYSGDTNRDMQVVGIATLAGADDAKVPTDVSAANGFPVALDAASLAALENITAVISGAVALDATTLAALETIGLDAATLAALETIQVASLPALPAGNNNIGDVDVLSSALPAGAATEATLAALAALLETVNAIATGDVAADAVDSGNPVKIGGYASVGFPALVAEGDRVSAWFSRSGAMAIALGTYIGTGDGRVSSYAASVNPVDPGVYADITVEPFLYNGATWDKQRTAKVFKTRADASITTGTPATIWTPTSGKKFRLMGLSLSVAVAGQIIIKDTTATEILRSPQLPAGGVWSPTDLGNGLLSAAANNVLAIDVSATGNVGGSVWGTEE